MININRIVRLSLISLAALTGAIGCSDKGRITGVTFRPDDEKRSFHYYADAQTQNGARQDATLQPGHFNGTELNTLGTAKLDEMIKGDGPLAVTVYLNFLPDATLDARKEVVSNYLVHQGVAVGNVKIETGLNPATFTPAAPSLNRLTKTESGTATAGGSDGGAAVGASAAN